MTEAIDLKPSELRSKDTKIIGLVGAAHLVSHYYILLLPPLFAFVRADFGVSYTELGLALTAFNLTSAALQTPAGFLIDRVGARRVLVAGLLLGGASVALAALVPSFWVFVLMFALLGVANTAYHPADYAILSQAISAKRMPSAFSVHTFMGILGSAIAPASLLLLQGQIGWRGAFLVAAIVAALVAVVLMIPDADTFTPVRPARKSAPTEPASDAPADPAADPSWRILLSGPIICNLVFFATAAVANAGLQNYSVVALGALRDTSPALANVALTGYLSLAALGVLLGGVVATRTHRHDAVAVIGFLMASIATFVVGAVDLGPVFLICVMALTGLFYGIVMPSRDMIVRAVTPPGSFGKVFGFVTTGFNIGGMISPLIYGWLMDSGNPAAVFVLSAACGAVTILAIVIGRLWPTRVMQ
jgi:FSR family fosmidomycin resistance protein-like MFS transporter